MPVTLIAIRPLATDDWQGRRVKAHPGERLEVSEEDALTLEASGLAYRHFERKMMLSFQENKMLTVAENKGDEPTIAIKRRK